MEISTFTEKLNKVDGVVHVVEEMVTLKNGVYEAVLEHDNIEENTLSVYTGPKLTGERIRNYALSTPSSTPWKRIIRVYANTPTVYISYETAGDTVEGEDINSIQTAVVATQEALNAEAARATEAEAVLTADLEAEINRAQGQETVIAEKLNEEVNRAQSAEAVLTANLALESERAQKKELALEVDLAAEAERAQKKEAELAVDLAAETSRAQAAETANAEKIADEISRAEAAEITNAEKVADEIKRAEAAETANTAAIAAEKNRATKAEAALQTTISQNKPVWDDKYTRNEIDNKFSTLETAIDWKEAVATYADLAKTYPKPEDGWTVNVKDTDYTYRWSGTAWVAISANSIPKATQSVDGLLSKEDKAVLDDTNAKKHTHSNKSVLDGITAALVTAWNNAVTHIGDTVKHITAAERTLWNTVSNKVDKVSGKGLSTNDYTAAEKAKLAGIAEGANKYVHPSTHPASMITGLPASLPLSGGTVSNTIHSSKTTGTYLAGNKGDSIIDSTAPAGSYTMLAKMNSTNGYFTEGCYQNKYLLQYTNKDTVTAGTNAVTKPVTLLDESGNAQFPGTVTAPTFSGNATTAEKWKAARNINGMSVQGDANRVNYGTCSTAAATAAKTVACMGFALITGAEVTIKFTVTNTAASPTLNVNGTGAKAIYYRGLAISAGYLAANRTYTFRYNGTQYDLVGDINTDTNTTYAPMTGATANTAGKTGLVPAPAAGKQGQFLRGDGTWQTPANTTYAPMTGATAGAAGKAGLVPAPTAGAQSKFLRGDGTWAEAPTGNAVLGVKGNAETAYRGGNVNLTPENVGAVNKAGDTLSGSITIDVTGQKQDNGSQMEAQLNFANGTKSVRFVLSATNKFGMYDVTKSRWLFYGNKDGEAIVNSTLKFTDDAQSKRIYSSVMTSTGASGLTVEPGDYLFVNKNLIANENVITYGDLSVHGNISTVGGINIGYPYTSCISCSTGNQFSFYLGDVYFHSTDIDDAKGMAQINAGGFITISSKKYKENLADITEDEANKLDSVRTYHFDYINGTKNQIGCIAEEVEEIYPEICAYEANEHTKTKEVSGIDYSKFVPYLIKKIQIMQKEIDKLKAWKEG